MMLVFDKSKEARTPLAYVTGFHENTSGHGPAYPLYASHAGIYLKSHRNLVTSKQILKTPRNSNPRNCQVG